MVKASMVKIQDHDLYNIICQYQGHWSNISLSPFLTKLINYCISIFTDKL